MTTEKKKIQVLDKGFVELIDFMGSDLTVVNAARVSFSKKSDWEYKTEKAEDDSGDFLTPVLSSKDTGLIKYLAKNNHWSPFAHPQICLHIKAPFPIRTQFFKHKVGFVENEISRRYVNEEPEFFFPMWSMIPDGSIKQGSGEIADLETRNKAYLIYSQALDCSKQAYNDILNLGIAPEQARFVMPLASYTEWYWTGSLASYARFYNQRSDSHAQKEIQQYAYVISEIIKEIFPVSWSFLTCQSTSEIE